MCRSFVAILFSNIFLATRFPREPNTTRKGRYVSRNAIKMKFFSGREKNFVAYQPRYSKSPFADEYRFSMDL